MLLVHTLRYRYRVNRIIRITTVCVAVVAYSAIAFAGNVDSATASPDAIPDTLWRAYTNQNLFQEAFQATLPCSHEYDDWDTINVHPDEGFAWDKTPLEFPLVDDDCAFTCPVPGQVTSNYGPRGGRMHKGIDLELDVGDSVKSSFDGMVRISTYSSSYGNVVVVRHYNGFETLYAHLSERNVEPGETMRAGQVLGAGGNTGRSTGPHLHFEVRYKGKAIDPNKMISFEDADRGLRSDTFLLTSNAFSPSASSRWNYRSTAAKHHYVKSGETLSSISRRYGTSVSSICSLSRIRTSTSLQVGQRLRVR